MNINALRLNQCIARSNLHLDDRKKIIALALARCIAYNLSLPTSAVESPIKYFTDTHADAVNTTLVQVNEICLINIQEAFELTFKVWRMRYSFVYDCCSVNIINLLDCEIENGNQFVPNIYSELYSKIGPETIRSFTNDVMMAMTSPEGV